MFLVALFYPNISIAGSEQDISFASSFRLERGYKEKLMLAPTVQITIFSKRGISIGSGTGVSIKYSKKTNRTHILTNAHICNASTDGNRLFGYNQIDKTAMITPNVEFFPLKVLHQDKTHDLCILVLTGKIQPVVSAKHSPKPFERLYVVGGPQGNFPVISETYMSGNIKRNSLKFQDMAFVEHDLIMISQISQPGHSGSPVFNSDGMLTAIIFANLNHFIPTALGIFPIESYGTLCISIEEIKDYYSSIGLKL